jgi:hypothetical protein
VIMSEYMGVYAIWSKLFLAVYSTGNL